MGALDCGSVAKGAATVEVCGDLSGETGCDVVAGDLTGEALTDAGEIPPHAQGGTSFGKFEKAGSECC